MLWPLAGGVGTFFGRDVDTSTGASQFIQQQCTRISDAEAVDWFVGFPTTSDGDEVTGASVAAAAFAQLHLELPRVATSPPRDGLQVVAVPVWFWVENFEPVSVTATIDDVSATLWATPTTTTIRTGEDGIVVTCVGPGVAYDTSRSHRDQESECSHAYDRHGPFTVEVTVTWALDWVATTGEAGSLAPVNRTTTYETTITELQAVTH